MNDEIKLPALIAYSELALTKNCNISEMSVRHSSQSGSVFPHRARALKDLELAKDNVKYVVAKIELDTHKLGFIPDVDDADRKIKITGASMLSYINAHPEAVKARTERADAEFNYDNVKGLVTTYNTNKALLEVMMSDRKSEWYSEPTEKAKDAVQGL